jgi:hypothetical protein
MGYGYLLMIQPPQRPQKGQPIPEDWFLQFYDYVRSLELHGDLKTTVVKRDRSGTTVRAPRRPFSPQDQAGPMIAQIDTDNGDGTYIATEQKNTSGTFADATSGLGAVFNNGSSQAGFLREIHGRKGVPVNSIVEVIPVTTVAGVTYWYFIAPYAPSFWAKITGETAGAYSWKALQGDASTDESPSRTGTTNALEVHGRLGIPTDTIVRMFPHPTDATKYRFVDDSGEPGTPETLATGSADSANSDDWDRASQGSSRGVVVKRVTRVIANTDDELVEFSRLDTFDADGHLILVSAETRRKIADLEPGTVACATSMDVDDPAVSSSLAHWWKADAIAGLSDGDSVTTWTASVGTNMTQPTSAKKPTYQTAEYNGLACVRFDGTDDYLRANSNLLGVSAFTVFVVGKRSGSGSAGALGEALAAYQYKASPANEAGFVFRYGGGGVGLQFIEVPGISFYAGSDSSLNIGVARRGGNSDRQLLQNGTSIATNTTTSTISWTDVAWTALGAQVYDDTSTEQSFAHLNGDICEAIIYHASLTDEQIAQITCGLKTKWGIA